MALHYFLLAFSTLLSSSWSQNLVCQKEVIRKTFFINPPKKSVPMGWRHMFKTFKTNKVWKPADEPAITDDGCEPYDGSLVPDCEYFLNNYTSYYHTHEYGNEMTTR